MMIFMDIRERESTDSFEVAQNLIEHLRSRLGNRSLTYLSPPVPIQKGFETSIYRFQLTKASEELSTPLILRIYPSRYHPSRAIFEMIVQNAAADMDYPAPRVYLACTDISVLGGAFIVMELMLGEPMMTAPLRTISKMLAEAHVRLHMIDPTGLVDALGLKGIRRDRYSLLGHLSWIREEIGPERREWLEEGLDWILRNVPPEPERLSICHGDFHPLNILMDQGKISGVLDWSGFLVADPAYDVASTKVIIEIAATSILKDFDFYQMSRRYINYYRRKIILEERNLEYYEALRCHRALLEGAKGQEFWTRPDVVRKLVNRFHEITGIEIYAPHRS